MTTKSNNALSNQEVILKPLFNEKVSKKYIKWLNEPQVIQFLEIRHSQPITEEDIIEFLTNCLKNRRHHWGIFVDGDHAGNISCSIYNHIYKWTDISILIGEEAQQGRGLGKLSLAGALDYLFSVCDLHRIQAGTYSENHASIGLFTSLGFTKEAKFRESVTVDGEYQDVIKFGILDIEWKTKRTQFNKAKVIKMPWE